MPTTRWERLRSGLASLQPARVSEPVQRAAVAVVLREAEPGLELLFIRRAEHPQDPWSGQIAFPGGRAEPGDPDLRLTAIRETAEEIGLDLASWGECLGSLDEVRAMARMRPMNLAITPFVFRLTGAPPELSLSGEVRSVHWIALDGLRDPERRSTLDYQYHGSSLRFPCLRIDGVVIWGLTYRMFQNLEAALDAPSVDPGAAPA